MKHLITLLLIVQCTVALSQGEALLKVISYSPGVTIGGEVPVIGQDFSDEKKKINILKGGYIGVITRDGFAQKIERSTTVGNASESWESRNRFTATGAVHRPLPVITVHPNQDDVRKCYLLQDTLVVSWEIYRSTKKDTTTFTVLDMYDNPLFETTITENYVLLPLKQYEKDNNVLVFWVRYGKKGGEQFFLKRKPAEVNLERFNNISLDLQNLPSGDDRLYYESALYLLNDFHYDSNFCMYKILKSKKKSSDPILDAYYNHQLEANKLKNVQLN